MKTRRILSILLSLAMALGMLALVPITASAAAPVGPDPTTRWEFTMPGSNVTVTAVFKNVPKGIFGTNAKWYGAWWHYVLFFIGFGFIWMWF